MKIGRNAPCPCGSGKKYKKCCLRKEQEKAHEESALQQAIGNAAGWLAKRYSEEVEKELRDNFFGALDPEFFDDLQNADPQILQVVLTNAHEWLLADGHLDVGGERKSVISLLMGAGGPDLGEVEKRWLEKLGEAPLGCYEPRQIEDGKGAWLQDLIDREREPIWVDEPNAAQLFPQKLSANGLRLLPKDDDAYALSPAFYSIHTADLSALVDSYRDRIQSGGDPSTASSRAVLEAWLALMVDEASQESGMWIADYELRDGDRLAAVLDARKAVLGSRTKGWIRYYIEQIEQIDELDDDALSWIYALNPSPDGGRLELCAESKSALLRGENWLAEFVGDTVVFEKRRCVAWELGDDDDLAELDLPAESRKEILIENYQHVPTRPVYAFDGKPPHLAVHDERYAPDVLKMLQKLEQRHLPSGESDGLLFLWEALGLDREATLATGEDAPRAVFKT